MKKIITTEYDNVLSTIETLEDKHFDNDAFRSGRVALKVMMTDRKYGSLDIICTNDYLLKRLQNQFSNQEITPQIKTYIAKTTVSSGILLANRDIIIYRILLSHYINNQENGYATITLDEIHQKYRDKNFMYKSGKDRFDKDTLQAYEQAFRKLCSLTIQVKFEHSKMKSFKYFLDKDKMTFYQPLLKTNVDVFTVDLTAVPITYSLGDLGTYFLNGGRYNQIMPREFYELRFNQIDTFNIALYICRMIFINRRKKEITIRVSTLLSNIMKYKKDGLSTGATYLEYLKTIESVKRSKQIKQLKNQIEYVLELLVVQSRVREYKIVGQFNYKFIKVEELALKIKVK